MDEDFTWDEIGEPPTGRWTLQLLGGFRLVGPRGEEPLAGRRDRALLAYLVLSRQPSYPRVKLGPLIWPDRSEAQKSLRTSLNTLRNAFGGQGRSIIVPNSDPLICHFDFLDVD